mgnify:FL=1
MNTAADKRSDKQENHKDMKKKKTGQGFHR